MIRSSLRLLSVLLLVILVFVGSMGTAREPDAAANKWNWLGGTRWYVPAENLLAYLADPSLSRSIPVADQTLWSLTEARDGHFQGTAYTEIWAKGPGGLVSATKNTMDGTITEDGTITIVFTPEDPDQPQTVGYGHMRFVDKAWRMEMQMATGTDTLAIHWAYMTQLKGNQESPTFTEQSLDGSLRAEEWKWLSGTDWAAADVELFADGAILSVDAFRNGYFWGEGESADFEPVRFLGSVTPEGDLYILFSVDGARAVARAGVIRPTGDSYEMVWGEPGGGTVLGGATLLP